MNECQFELLAFDLFLNAAIHWLLDQESVFLHFWQLLKPNGELLIEYTEFIVM
jgi:trans-aconitate methyltransferase